MRCNGPQITCAWIYMDVGNVYIDNALIYAKCFGCQLNDG